MNLGYICSRLCGLSWIRHGPIRVDSKFQLQVIPKSSIQRNLNMTLIGRPKLLLYLLFLLEKLIIISLLEVRREIKRDGFKNISSNDSIRIVIIMKYAVFCRTV